MPDELNERKSREEYFAFLVLQKNKGHLATTRVNTVQIAHAPGVAPGTMKLPAITGE